VISPRFVASVKRTDNSTLSELPPYVCCCSCSPSLRTTAPAQPPELCFASTTSCCEGVQLASLHFRGGGSGLTLLWTLTQIDPPGNFLVGCAGNTALWHPDCSSHSLSSRFVSLHVVSPSVSVAGLLASIAPRSSYVTGSPPASHCTSRRRRPCLPVNESARTVPENHTRAQLSHSSGPIISTDEPTLMVPRCAYGSAPPPAKPLRSSSRSTSDSYSSAPSSALSA